MTQLYIKSPRVPAGRLRLDCITDSDRNSMLTLFSSDEVRKTYMLPEFRTEEEKISLFQRFKQLSQAPDRFVYGIFLQDSLIGFLNEVEVNDGEMEVGYVISPYHRNQGYATEALHAAIQELFRIGFFIVRAGAFEENSASLRVMGKCGMIKTGQTEKLEYRGAVHNCIFCEIRNPKIG